MPANGRRDLIRRLKVNLVQRVKISGAAHVSSCRPKEKFKILPLFSLRVRYIMLPQMLPVSKRVAYFSFRLAKCLSFFIFRYFY